MQHTPHSELAGAILTIDLGALKHNWKTLAAQQPGARCGAAVKGDAYGLGLAPVAHALAEAGCDTFFVARAKEGEDLRALLPRAEIYVLDGLLSGQAEYYAKLNLRPALNAIEEAREWSAFGRVYGRKLECALHVDTGINRLGFTMAEFDALLADAFLLDGLTPSLLMSHLACADDPPHPMNARQRDRFLALRGKLPGVPASFANSSGIYLGADYAHDVLRPGIALYGGNPTPGKPNPMRPVAILEGTILQARDVAEGDTVGYSATWTAKRPTRIAILGAGYKDGVPRALSSRQNDGPAQVWLAGQRCPVIGRISMDMMAIDVTDVPRDAASRGARAEIFGHHVGIDEVAGWAGTISYELLTHLGSRYARLYRAQEQDTP